MEPRLLRAVSSPHVTSSVAPALRQLVGPSQENWAQAGSNALPNGRSELQDGMKGKEHGAYVGKSTHTPSTYIGNKNIVLPLFKDSLRTTT